VSSDERAESLAAQAAAWVPPWERAPRDPDRAYQAAAEDETRAGLDSGDDPARDASGHDSAHAASADHSAHRDESAHQDERGEAGRGGRVEAQARAGGFDEERERRAQEEAREEAGPADSGPAFAVPSDTKTTDESNLSDDDDDFDSAFEGPNPEAPEFEPEDDESTGVDEGVDSPEEESVEDAVGPELPLPESIEDAAIEVPDVDEPGIPVDAPLPVDGDDAGDVFDQAADDDVSDGEEMDLPFSGEAPDPGADVDEDDVDEDEDDVDEEELERSAGDADDDDDALRQEETSLPDDRAFAAREMPVATAPVAPEVAVPGQTRRVAQPDVAVSDTTSRTNEIDLPGLTEDEEFVGALEAIMLVVDEPVAELQLAQILEQPTERVALMLDNLSARYTAAGHGFDLRRAAGGWRLYTRPEYAAYVERFVLDGQSVRLTQAALETLAVVAYKQPVTRSRISAIRGVNCDGVMRTLVTRGLIEECGTESETGAHLYRTTGLFLEKLGLNSVDQLPPLAPFLPDDVEEVLDATG